MKTKQQNKNLKNNAWIFGWLLLAVKKANGAIRLTNGTSVSTHWKSRSIFASTVYCHILPSHSHQRSAVWTLLSFSLATKWWGYSYGQSFACHAPLWHSQAWNKAQEYMEESCSGGKAKNPAHVGLTQAGHQVPTKAILSLPISAGQGRENTTESSKAVGRYKDRDHSTVTPMSNC